MIDRVWYGSDAVARASRAALTPLSWIWRGSIGARNALYDLGVLRTVVPAVPTLSVGNLSTGGTGKTPFATYLVGQLLARGARPGIVLRGYGGDEERVHRLLTPGVPVLVGADRIRAIGQARAAGCDVAVLDDAFQHRRAGRMVDIVLVSADVPWVERLLPAGPLREPVTSLQRASLLVITCKAAAERDALALTHRLVGHHDLPVTLVRLQAHALVPVQSPGETIALDVLRHRRVLVVAGIGNPKALLRQLEAHGAVVTASFYPDHHQYSGADVQSVLARAAGVDFVVCTLKDAVKLQSLWPDKGRPLLYVSQRVELMNGEGHLETALDRLVAARPHSFSTTAG